MAFTPTPEQQAIYDAALTGQNLVIEAGAGSGKTTTLRGIAELPDMYRLGAYFAYNAAVAADAKASFPKHIKAATIHGHCYRRAVQELPWIPDRLPVRNGRGMPTQRGSERAKILGITGPTLIAPGVAPLATAQVARLATATLERFAYSADFGILEKHVPRQEGPLGLHHDDLAAAIVPVARQAWEDVRSPRGRLRWTPDYYVKMAHMAGATFDVEYLFLDEAQDSNDVTVALAQRQVQANGTQIITVGDRMQSLYGWRGAKNGMDAFGGLRLMLTKSFRFGHAIAAEANKWLAAMDSDMQIVGHDPIDSVVGHIEPGTEDAVLCRTNAEAMRRVMEAHAAGRSVALVDGKDPGKQMADLADACDQFREEGWTWHPELQGWSSWAQVQDYVEQDGGSEFATAVKLIDEYGTDAIKAAVAKLTRRESDASLVVTTAHRSKGREWDRVVIADDFFEPKKDEAGNITVDPSEGMLAYVAVTRAKNVLHRGNLSYIDRVRAARTAPTEPARESITLHASPIPDERTVCGAPRLDGRYPAVDWSCDLEPGHLGREGTEHAMAEHPHYTWLNATELTLGASA